MGGVEDRLDELFSYVRLEERIPCDHPLRPIRASADEVLEGLNSRFDALYSGTGRPSIRPEMLLRATHQLMQARDERRLLKTQRDLQSVKLLTVDELGYVPLSPKGAELLFEVFSQRYERGSTIVTSNLPFEDWTSVLHSERLTGALLDRLTHHIHIHILTMNGDSYRLKQSSGRRRFLPRRKGRSKTRPPMTLSIRRPERSPQPDPQPTAPTHEGARSGPFVPRIRHRRGLLLELLRR